MRKGFKGCKRCKERDDAMFEIDRLIKLALDEDIGTSDLTTSSVIDPGIKGNAQIIAKEDLILAGIDIFCSVFTFLNSEVTFNKFFKDGDFVNSNSAVAEISCDVIDLLRGERVALNFLQRLSGIASLTRRYVDRVKGYNAKVLDTRKTTPGWRSLEKYAVKVGGGTNHRSGLFDGILIKDNHIKACGGIRQAVEKARANIPHTFKIEVEAKDLNEVREALESGVEIIMLDNMDTEEMGKAVKVINKRAVVEASGGINLDNIVDVAKTGVDLISVGALTHSARACDISMNIVGIKG
ncbi:MAG: nicotinate-nucleotide pyrophosphorylase (carboxylating) [bacterium]|nr:MAG: nicotinate-nucleotide pyrophosphorylase (carboxylating) [bacterium]